MLDKYTRLFLFILVCLPIRLLIAWVPYFFKLSNTYLLLYGMFLYAIGTSFLVLYFGKYRLNAPEGGGNTWWHSFRIIHGLLYCLSGILLLLKWLQLDSDIQNAYSFLQISQLMTIDVLVGLYLFVSHELS